MKNKLHSLKWFEDRIGKRIYRDYSECDCACCQEGMKNGVVVRDREHAEYIYKTQNEFALDRTFLNYRDNK